MYRSSGTNMSYCRGKFSPRTGTRWPGIPKYCRSCDTRWTMRDRTDFPIVSRWPKGHDIDGHQVLASKPRFQDSIRGREPRDWCWPVVLGTMTSPLRYPRIHTVQISKLRLTVINTPGLLRSGLSTTSHELQSENYYFLLYQFWEYKHQVVTSLGESFGTRSCSHAKDVYGFLTR